MMKEVIMGLSGLECRYGFEHSGFRAYVATPDPEVSEASLRRHELAMSDSPVPMVAYAAGWAAVELTVYPGVFTGGRVALDERLGALERAKRHWRASLETSVDQGGYSEVEHERQAQNAWELQMRTRRALATAPLMEAAAHMLAGQMPSEDFVAERVETVKRQTAQVMEDLLAAPDSGTKTHLVSDYTTGAVGLYDEHSTYLWVPSSFRQRRQEAQPNYTLVASWRPHKKICVRVQTKVTRANRPLTVVARRDLVSPGGSVIDTARAHIDSARDAKQSPGLTALAKRLVDKVYSFK